MMVLFGIWQYTMSVRMVSAIVVKWYYTKIFQGKIPFMVTKQYYNKVFRDKYLSMLLNGTTPRSGNLTISIICYNTKVC